MQLNPTTFFGKRMHIIDVHAHTFFKHPDFSDIAKGNGADFSLEGLRKECATNMVDFVGTIYNDFDGQTPIGVEEFVRQRQQLPAMFGIGIVHPLRTKKDSLKKTEEAILDGTIKALKIYPGYYPVYCTDERLHPYYRLAGKHDIPFYIHSGDTMGKGTLLKYARPLHVDEVAVAFPETNFIITQMGNPWLIDAAEVAYKNDNVYLDTAGLFSGMQFSEVYTKRLQYVVEYIDDPRKFLYGSDWPMVRMADYIKFVKSVFPKDMHQKVFHDNARKLFRL
ncbi:MAG: amidohydrolase family protein [Nanoarchaeota archaeon]